MAVPRNLAISEANVAYKLEVLHKPGAITTVSALPANSFLTLESTRPSSLITGADGDVTEETLQTFTYIQTEYELDSNQKPKKIEFPTVTTTCVIPIESKSPPSISTIKVALTPAVLPGPKAVSPIAKVNV